MTKVLQVTIYKSISDDAKLAAYAELAGPAMVAAGAMAPAKGMARALLRRARDIPVLLPLLLLAP